MQPLARAKGSNLGVGGRSLVWTHFCLDTSPAFPFLLFLNDKMLRWGWKLNPAASGDITHKPNFFWLYTILIYQMRNLRALA